MAGQRKAWLVLGAQTRPLDDLAAGWVCTELDLGGINPREVTSNKPDQHGVDDHTQFLGGRVVTANMTALPDGTVPLDAVVSGFAPYVDPGARPELHYTLIDDKGERVLTLRGASNAASMPTPSRRDFQLAWTASDPVARGAQVHQATAWAGSGQGTLGRNYDLTFDRIYDVSAGSPVVGIIESSGELPFAPVLDIFGPITNPVVTLTTTTGDTWVIRFKTDYRVDAGHRVTVDCVNHLVYPDGDDSVNHLASLDWASSTLWPWLPILPASTTMMLNGSGTTGVSQVRAQWHDRYLS